MPRRFTRILLGAIVLAASGCNMFPWLQEVVALPDGHTIARIMIRAGGEYRIIVQNDHGKASHSVAVPVDDGHREANLYLTPDNWLVVIDAGGDDAFFDITPVQAPRDITSSHGHRTDTQSREWRYLGTVTRDGPDSLKFWTPSTKAECISLYGTGRSPYRIAYQAWDICPWRNVDRIQLHQRLLAGNASGKSND